jgi:hypothetical protein
MNFYRESLNFPVFRNVGVNKMNPYNFETPAEYLSLDNDNDGKAAMVFFYNILVVCRDELDGNYELFSILSIMRAVGIKFVPHKKFGFVIKPIEGPNGWESGQYNDFKQYLKKYQSKIIDTLALTHKILSD